MPQIFAARAQMGTSLVFHIVFSVLGVGLPLLLCIAEGLALRYEDPTWMRLARQWTKAFAIVFAIGAVSGAIVEFEIGLLWPTFTRNAGAIIGLPFAMEGFAFFTEAIFLGIYLYGWERLSPRVHWLCSFPVVISGLASAWFITSANSWMNTPAGFKLVNGQVTGIDPVAAIFNPSTPYETTHMILACYVATGFGTAGVYAVALLRKRNTDYNRRGLLLGMAMGIIAIPLQIISGDFNARYLAHQQPVKYAAMEGIFESGKNVPLYLGGIPDPATGKTLYAIQIPNGESLLVNFNTTSVSRGLNEFPRADWPNPIPVHLAFDVMVGCGFFILLVGALFWFIFYRRGRTLPTQRWLLWGIAVAAPLSFLAIESGWIVTEEGRQPWIIYNWLRTSQAATPSQFMNVTFLIFSVIYIILGTTLAVLLLRLGREPEPQRTWREYVLSSAGSTRETI